MSTVIFVRGTGIRELVFPAAGGRTQHDQGSAGQLAYSAVGVLTLLPVTPGGLASRRQA